MNFRVLSREYIEGLTPQDPDQLGSASLLLFGPAGEISAELAPLIAAYRLPPHADGNVALSFGVGASGSGVPFHVHGHGWAECIHGAKVLIVFCVAVCNAEMLYARPIDICPCCTGSAGCCSRLIIGRRSTRMQALAPGCATCCPSLRYVLLALLPLSAY